MDILWYLEYSSKNEYASHLAIMLNTSFVNHNGKGSFFVVEFNFMKST